MIEHRRELGKVVEALGDVSSESELKNVIVRLRPLLNGYGKRNKVYEHNIKNDIIEEEHIWKLLEEIENSLTYQKEHRNKLLDYLVLMMQFEAEQIEDSVKPGYGFIFSNILYIIGISMSTFTLWHSQMIEEQEILVYVVMQFIWYLPLVLTYLSRKMKMFQTRNWYRDIDLIMVTMILGGVILILTDLVCVGRKIDFVGYWYMEFLVKFVGIMGVFFSELDARNMYVEYNRRVSRIMGEEEITLYYWTEGIKMLKITDELYKWNVYYKFVRTKSKQFDYAMIFSQLAEKDDILKCWNGRVKAKKTQEDKVRYINKHPRKVNLICEYKGEYRVIRKGAEVENMIEEILNQHTYKENHNNRNNHMNNEHA